jgi:hypothetical protein
MLNPTSSIIFISYEYRFKLLCIFPKDSGFPMH